MNSFHAIDLVTVHRYPLAWPPKKALRIDQGKLLTGAVAYLEALLRKYLGMSPARSLILFKFVRCDGYM